MNKFLRALDEQRWDDHRFYHHSRINQTLHLVSALSFLATYGLLLAGKTVFAVLFGWTFAMVVRQVGHFFFEPKGYDRENDATHQYKESVKVGYNLRRKVILHSIWAAAPLALLLHPTLFGLFHEPHDTVVRFLDHMAWVWLVVAGAALLFRTIHLFFLRDALTGLVWFTKILTDPFHDVLQYWRAPIYLLRGERMDPMLPRERA